MATSILLSKYGVLSHVVGEPSRGRDVDGSDTRISITFETLPEVRKDRSKASDRCKNRRGAGSTRMCTVVSRDTLFVHNLHLEG